jgi:periplasmic copper chaperone A
VNRLLSFTALALSWSPLFAAPVAISNAWTRATPPGTTVTALYAQLRSSQDDEIVAVSCALAERVEIHASTQTNGMMQMRRVERLKVTAGVPLKFAPGGLHLMIMGLREPLVVGRSLAVTFTFRAAGSITIKAEIVAPGNNGPS